MPSNKKEILMFLVLFLFFFLAITFFRALIGHAATIQLQPGDTAVCVTSSPTNTPTQAPTASPSASASPTATVLPPTESPSPTAAPTGSATATSAPTPTAIGTPIPRQSITASGTSSNPLVFDGTGRPISLGFDVSGSYVTIQNWNISTQVNQPGIHVMGSASHISITENYIHELCQEGVYVEPTASYVSVTSNRIWRAEMAGAQMDGYIGFFSGNEVWDIQQYPSALGGIYASCTRRSGADADGVRVFGTNQNVLTNYFHDIADDWGSARNLNPHTDCVQSWGPLAGLAYTGNICAWSAPTSMADKEFCEFEALNGAKTTGLTFTNNVFINGRDGCQFESPITGVNFSNNTLVGVLNEGANFNTNGNTITNNISYDSGDGGDAAWCASSGNIVTGNVRYNPSGSYGTYCSAYPETRVNPLFVSIGTGFASYPNANVHLQIGSPVVGKGAYP